MCPKGVFDSFNQETSKNLGNREKRHPSAPEKSVFWAETEKNGTLAPPKLPKWSILGSQRSLETSVIPKIDH